MTEKNWAVWILISIAIMMMLLIISIPFLQQIFSLEFPGYKHFISSLMGAVSVLIVLETVKYLKRRKKLLIKN